MPYGATDADLRTHFGAVGAPSQIVIPVDRETGRPRGFAFVEYLDRAMAEAAIAKFNQQPFMGRSLSVSEARPREAGGAGGGGFRPAGPGGFRPGGGGGFGGPRPPGGGFGGPRPMGGPPGAAAAGPQRFGPPKKKSASSEKRWEAKERGPKGPIKERYSGRMDGLYDAPDDTSETLTDFDDIASTAPKDEASTAPKDDAATTPKGDDKE
jgi:RNA recognition motif-containing protein